MLYVLWRSSHHFAQQVRQSLMNLIEYNDSKIEIIIINGCVPSLSMSDLLISYAPLRSLKSVDQQLLAICTTRFETVGMIHPVISYKGNIKSYFSLSCYVTMCSELLLYAICYLLLYVLHFNVRPAHLCFVRVLKCQSVTFAIK